MSHRLWFKVLINTILRTFQTRKRPARLRIRARVTPKTYESAMRADSRSSLLDLRARYERGPPKDERRNAAQEVDRKYLNYTGNESGFPPINF